MVRGPDNARALLHAFSQSNGQTTLKWAVGSQEGSGRTQIETVDFYPWPRRNPMSRTDSLLFVSWSQLMEKVKIILAEPNGPSDNVLEADARERARYEARGMAEILAILMHPFMENADAVVKAAVKKHKDPEFEVPGLGEHLWDPQRNPDGSPRVAISSPKTKPVAKPKVKSNSTKTLSANEKDGIKEAVGSGMFSKEEIASMFGVSMTTLEEALSS